MKRGKGRKRSEAIAIVSALDRNTELENTDRRNVKNEDPTRFQTDENPSPTNFR